MDNATHRRWAQQMRTFIFDIDGVIHNAGKPIAGAAEALAALRANNKKVMFMTNNATKSPADVVELFAKFGAIAHVEEVMTSAVAAGDFLSKNLLKGQNVYVVGMKALVSSLREQAGVHAFGGPDDSSKTREDVVQGFLPELDPPATKVAAVVVGADFEFNYYKLTKAANYLRQNPECIFVATNPDPRALLGPGVIVPACGAMSQAIAIASGRQPDIICGKPSVSLARHLLASRGFDPKTTCMVGDRTDTDIAFGRSVGMQTLWVASGSMSEQELKDVETTQAPHFMASSIAVLPELLKFHRFSSACSKHCSRHYAH